MALEPGTRLGPYEVVGALGAGGMGEVYRATDTRLARTVAIKVLPAGVAGDPVLRERFEREARSVAALSHPNICTAYDVGRERPAPRAGVRGAAGAEAGSVDPGQPVDFLVMEFLDGQTLAERLERGSLPLAEALRIAGEIAEALDAAHRQGIVHRDLKPGNVMLTETGVKLLDFGLARLHEAESTKDAASAPTRTALTTEGAILGTLQYMAPEQLDGRAADARADIFAFGATLYEMLAGARAFDGGSQASIIGSILKDEPRSIREVAPGVPRGLDRLLRACLAKDPDDRWQTMRDLKRELRWIAQAGESGEPGGETGPEQDPGAAPQPAASGGRALGGWRLAASLVVTATVSAVAGLILRPVPEAPPAGVQRFTIDLDAGRTLTNALAISPDGRRVVYGAAESGTTRLFSRALDEFESTPIPGTEGVVGVALSPDGQQVALHLQDDGRWTLNRIPLDGGSPFTIADGPGNLYPRFAWLPDDTIAYSAIGGAGGGGLMRIPASGGQPRALTQPQDQYADVWPLAVPGRGEILFTNLSLASRQLMEDGSNVAVYSPEAAGTRVLIENAVGLGYVEPGFLLYGDRNSLMGVGVDLDALAVTGVPTPLFFDRAGEDVGSSAMSRTGTLVYIVRPDASAGEDVPNRIHVVVNWFTELTTLLQAG